MLDTRKENKQIYSIELSEFSFVIMINLLRCLIFSVLSLLPI